MAALSWEEIVERGKQHNKTVICEVEKRGRHRYYKVKCDICEFENKKTQNEFNACKNCSINKLRNRLRYDKERFIYKAITIHDDKYNYDLVEYIDTETKVKILCNTCNNIFEQKPKYHLARRGCLKCSYRTRAKTRTKSMDFFLEEAKKIHGDRYNYDLVEYYNAVTKVKIRCNICNNIFEQVPYSHLQEARCRKCSNILLHNKYKSNKEDFIYKANNKHGNKYNYDLVEYISSRIKVKISCNKCKKIFEQTPNTHLRGRGCPKCNESKGENKIAKYLSDKNIRYTRNKIFKTLKDKSYLRPDFYLEEFNLLIEYDGRGHFEPCFSSILEEKQKNLEETQRRDKIKDEWAKANNIPLLRIPYWDFDRIEELIDAFILQHTRKKETKQLVLEM